MKINQLMKNYVHREHKERVYGRYHASEIGSIMGGWKKPEDFFKPNKIELKGCKMILVGCAMEDQLTKIFKYNKVDCKTQLKRVIKIDEEISIVVKPDYIFDDFIIETKFPFSEISSEVPDRYKAQLECEHRAFKKKVYLGVLTSPFDLRLLPYKESDKLWQEIQEVLKVYHKKVKK